MALMSTFVYCWEKWKSMDSFGPLFELVMLPLKFIINIYFEFKAVSLPYQFSDEYPFASAN